MDKFLDALRKLGLRKVALGLAFLSGLTFVGYSKVLDSADWKSSFQALAFCVFTSNAAEHFAKKDKPQE